MQLPIFITQQALDRAAMPDETTAVVLSLDGGGSAPYTITGRGPRRYQFPWVQKAGAHVLRFPESLWNAKKGEIARDIFTRTVKIKTIIPTTAPWVDATLRPVRQLPTPTAVPVPAGVPDEPAEPRRTSRKLTRTR